MSSQAGKAALAALAALFILLALATSSWWSGNLAGSGRRSASIGLLGGVGCNKIGEQTCQSISLSKASSGFAVLGVATFGFGTLAMVGCLALGWLGWRQDPRQRKLAPLTLGVAAAGVLVAIGFILTKPKFIAVPVSYGLVLGLLGFALAAGRAVLGLNASSANAGLYHQAGLQHGYAAAPNPTFDPANPMGSIWRSFIRQSRLWTRVFRHFCLKRRANAGVWHGRYSGQRARRNGSFRHVVALFHPRPARQKRLFGLRCRFLVRTHDMPPL